MSTVRVPAGTPDGGKFAPSRRPEADLRLVVSNDSPPPFPSPSDIAAENRHQRAEEYATRLHAIATHPGADQHTRRMAAMTALDKAADARGSFLSLPPDDGEAQSYVADALLDDAKVDAALERVGILSDDDAHSFADRLAGALYDVETADREQRLFNAALVDAPAVDSSDEAWAARFADAPRTA